MLSALKFQSRALVTSRARNSLHLNGSYNHYKRTISNGQDRAFSSSITAGRRLLNIGVRTFLSIDDLIDLHSENTFLREMSDEQIVSLFFITRVPETSDPIDLRTFLKGAKQAIQMVLTNIYSKETQELESPDKNELLNSVATRPSVHNFMLKLPSIKKLGHLKGAGVRLELEKLDIKKIQFASAQYELINLGKEKQKQKGSNKEEWLQIEVAYDMVEHLRFIATSGLEDRMIFNTKFKCTFESNVSKGQDLDWRICQVSNIDQKPAILTTTASKKEEEEVEKE
jgi:hypothetical protein